jgi:hypothetical protein
MLLIKKYKKVVNFFFMNLLEYHGGIFRTRMRKNIFHGMAGIRDGEQI